MLRVKDALTESWTPDFGSSGQSSPTWTRLLTGGLELANSLEAPDWDENPVQVAVCEACGFPQCATGGYVHVSNTPQYVVWTAPQVEIEDEIEAIQYAPAACVGCAGCVLITRGDWDSLSESRGTMPNSSRFGPVTGRALLDGWWLSAPHVVRSIPSHDRVSAVRSLILACDSLTPEEGAERIRGLFAWLESSSGAPVSGEFVSLEATAEMVETLYLDGPRTEEWHAFVVSNGKTLPAFSREWVFLPEAT